MKFSSPIYEFPAYLAVVIYSPVFPNRKFAFLIHGNGDHCSTLFPLRYSHCAAQWRSGLSPGSQLSRHSFSSMHPFDFCFLCFFRFPNALRPTADKKAVNLATLQYFRMSYAHDSCCIFLCTMPKCAFSHLQRFHTQKSRQTDSQPCLAKKIRLKSSGPPGELRKALATTSPYHSIDHRRCDLTLFSLRELCCDLPPSRKSRKHHFRRPFFSERRRPFF